LVLSTITSADAFLPFATPSTRITAPLTPRSAPTRRASDALWSPQMSRFLFTAIGSSFGAVPLKRTTPVTAPGSLTAVAS
jgi:hypothetical protein